MVYIFVSFGYSYILKRAVQMHVYTHALLKSDSLLCKCKYTNLAIYSYIAMVVH